MLDDRFRGSIYARDMEMNVWVREARKKLGLSQEALGAALGVTKGNVSAWENGRHRPDLQLIGELSRLSGLRYDLGGHSVTDKVLIRRITGAHLAAGDGEIAYDFEAVADRSFDAEWMRSRGLKAENCMLWTSRGDSMYPTIESGELVLVHLREREPMHAKVFALITEDGLRLKRLMRKSDNTWEIRSDNEDKRLYPTEPFVAGEVAIMGRVRWHAGEM